jgi:hypothetical protein
MTDEEIKALQDQLADLKKKNDALVADASTKDTQVKDLQNQNSTLQADASAKADQIKSLMDQNATLSADASASADQYKQASDGFQKQLADLKQENSDLKAETAKNAPLTFEVEPDADHGIEGGTYEFTAPSVHWDDNKVYVFKELAAAKDEKTQAFYALMCAELIQRKSGLVARKGESNE